jgi:hypothetical protein
VLVTIVERLASLPRFNCKYSVSTPATVAAQRKSPSAAIAAQRLAQTPQPPDWQLIRMQR